MTTRTTKKIVAVPDTERIEKNLKIMRKRRTGIKKNLQDMQDCLDGKTEVDTDILEAAMKFLTRYDAELLKRVNKNKKKVAGKA